MGDVFSDLHNMLILGKKVKINNEEYTLLKQIGGDLYFACKTDIKLPASVFVVSYKEKEDDELDKIIDKAVDKLEKERGG